MQMGETHINKKKWTFLSNHGRIFTYVAEHPHATTQSIAEKADLSIRAVQTILDDMEEEGYIARERIGRGNLYTVNPDKPLRHRLEKHHKIGVILQALGIEVKSRYILCK
jgi:predicted transcriptional regulator